VRTRSDTRRASVARASERCGAPRGRGARPRPLHRGAFGDCAGLRCLPAAPPPAGHGRRLTHSRCPPAPCPPPTLLSAPPCRPKSNNIMYDKRVVRGSTYAMPVIPHVSPRAARARNSARTRALDVISAPVWHYSPPAPSRLALLPPTPARPRRPPRWRSNATPRTSWRARSARCRRRGAPRTRSARARRVRHRPWRAGATPRRTRRCSSRC
jgi:hypothetical protein